MKIFNLFLVSCILSVIQAGLAGGTSVWKKLTADDTKKFIAYQNAVQTFSGKTYTSFVPKQFKSQVVAGMFYTIQYDIGDKKTIEVKVFQPLPHTNAPAEVKYIKDADGNMQETKSGAHILHVTFMALVAGAAMTM